MIYFMIHDSCNLFFHDSCNLFQGAVIIIGMVEKTMFYSEYATMNMNGSTVDGFIEVIFYLFLLLNINNIF